MAFSNDSILVTPGVGTDIAMHLANAKKHQVTIDSDDLGNIGNDPEYTVYTGEIASATNSLEYINMFNTNATKIVRIKGLWLIYNGGAFTITTPVEYIVDIISSAGTGGGAFTPRKLDSSMAALPAGITVKGNGTAAGGAVSAYELWRVYTLPVQAAMDINLMAYHNQLPKLREEDPSIVLRQNEGIRVRMANSVTTAPTMAGLVHFSVEG